MSRSLHVLGSGSHLEAEAFDCCSFSGLLTVSQTSGEGHTSFMLSEQHLISMHACASWHKHLSKLQRSLHCRRHRICWRRCSKWHLCQRIT